VLLVPASLDIIVRPGHDLQQAFKYTMVDLTHEPRCLAVMTHTVPAAIPYPVVDLQVPPLWDQVGGQAGSVSHVGIFGVVNGEYCEKNEKGYVEEDRGHIWHKEGRNVTG
jgi:hypothetical protein